MKSAYCAVLAAIAFGVVTGEILVATGTIFVLASIHFSIAENVNKK